LRDWILPNVLVPAILDSLDLVEERRRLELRRDEMWYGEKVKGVQAVSFLGDRCGRRWRQDNVQAPDETSQRRAALFGGERRETQCRATRKAARREVKVDLPGELMIGACNFRATLAATECQYRFEEDIFDIAMVQIIDYPFLPSLAPLPLSLAAERQISTIP
jgi:hypothetical protein